MKLQKRYRNNQVLWTIEDLRFLEQNYNVRSVTEIAERLGRSPGGTGSGLDRRRNEYYPSSLRQRRGC